MSVVITVPPKTPHGQAETVILLRYGDTARTREPTPPTSLLDVERAKRAVAAGRGIKVSDLQERRVGE